MCIADNDDDVGVAVSDGGGDGCDGCDGCDGDSDDVGNDGVGRTNRRSHMQPFTEG